MGQQQFLRAATFMLRLANVVVLLLLLAATATATAATGLHEQLRRASAFPLSHDEGGPDGDAELQRASRPPWCADILSAEVQNRGEPTDLFVAKLRVPAIAHGAAFARLAEFAQHFDDGAAVHFGTAAVLLHAPWAAVTGRLLHDRATTRHLQLLCPLRPEHKIEPSLRAPLIAAARASATLSVAGDVLVAQTCIRAVGLRVRAGALLPPSCGSWADCGWELGNDFGGAGGSHIILRACCAALNVTCLTHRTAEAMSQPHVYFVERHDPIGTLHNKFSRGLLQSGVMYEEPLHAAGIRGAGHVVGVADTGIDHDHCFFFDPAVPNIAYDVQMAQHRKLVRYARVVPQGQFSNGDFKEGHGTHVAGTVAGFALSDAEDAAAFHGIAPDAKLSFTDMSGMSNEGITLPLMMQSLFRPAMLDGARVHSNSWGTTLAKYTTLSQEVDIFAAANPDFLVVFSAGNEADKACEGRYNDIRCDRFTVSSPSTNKNGLAVGASMAPLPSWEMAAFGNYLMPVEAGPGTRRNVVCARADFGPVQVPEDLANKRAVWTQPDDACGALTSSVAGNVAFTWRGRCHFEDKAKRLQAAGAVGMIVVNNEPGDPFTMGSSEDSHSGNKGVGIPSFMISRADGLMIGQWLDADIDVRVSLRSTNANDPKKDPENLSSFSSHGPTTDFRFKPDIVAVGEFVHSAYSDNDLRSRNCDLWPSMGTSMSCPLISGTAALLREYFIRGFYANGEERSGPPVQPTSALLKAVLVHTARPLRGIFDRNTQADWHSLGTAPSFEQGHGIPNLNRSLPIGKGSRLRLYFDQDSQLASGAVQTFCVDFDGESEFRAVLAWTDPPSSALMKFHLVNNLDLSVTTPNGRVYWGNAHGPDTAQRDVLNNLEKVTIPGGEAAPRGTYLVSITAVHIQGATQRYAVVASGEGVPACEVHCAACVRGHCDAVAGRCVCDWGFTGAACDIPVPTLSAGESVTFASISPMGWRYVRLELPESAEPLPDLTLSILSADPISDPDIYVLHNEVPTLLNTDRAIAKLDECDNCNVKIDALPTPGPKVLTVPSTRGRMLMLGVVSMCCYDSMVHIEVVNGRTRTPSVFSLSHGEAEHSSTAHLAVNLSSVSTANPLRVIISGRFDVLIAGASGATPAPDALKVSFGRDQRTELRCVTRSISATSIECAINELPVEFHARKGQLFGVLLEADELVVAPCASSVSLVAATDVDRRGDSYREETKAPASLRRRVIIGVSNRPCGEDAGGQACPTGRRLVLPATFGIRGGMLFFLAPENFTSAERQMMQAVQLVDHSDTSNSDVACTLQPSPARTIQCTVASALSGGHFIPGHTFAVRVVLRDGSVDDLPLEVVSIHVMPATRLLGLVVRAETRASAADAMLSPSEVAAAQKNSTFGSGLLFQAAKEQHELVIFITGRNFDPRSHHPADAVLSVTFEAPVEVFVGPFRCPAAKIASDTLMRCIFPPNSTSLIPTDEVLDVNVVAPQFYAPHDAGLAVSFAIQAHNLTIEGVGFDSALDAIIVSSLTLTIRGADLSRNISIVLRTSGRSSETAITFQCIVKYATRTVLLCQVPGSTQLPASDQSNTVYEVSARTPPPKALLLLSSVRIVLREKWSRILGVGTAPLAPGSVAPLTSAVQLDEPSGDVLDPVGPLLYIYGENLPPNVTAKGWSIVLVGVEGNDDQSFGCAVISGFEQSIVCATSPYAYGRRSLTITEPSAVLERGVQVPMKSLMTVIFSKTEPPPLQQHAATVIVGLPLVLGARSVLTVRLDEALAFRVVVSTNGCGAPIPLQQLTEESERAEGSTVTQFIIPLEVAVGAVICVAPVASRGRPLFYFQVSSHLPVWHVTSLTVAKVHAAGSSPLVGFEQHAASDEKPPEGFVAATPVAARSSLRVAVSMSSRGVGEPSLGKLVAFAFSLSRTEGCSYEGDDEYRVTGQAQRLREGIGESILINDTQFALLVEDSPGPRTLCLRLDRPFDSPPIALARLEITLCVTDSDCHNNGKCAAVPGGARCECRKGYSGATCESLCPIAGDRICSGQGSCDAARAICMCEPGFVGAACSFRVRPAVVSNMTGAFPPMTQAAVSLLPQPSDHEVAATAQQPTSSQSLLVFRAPSAPLDVPAAVLDILVYSQGAVTDVGLSSGSTPISVDIFTWNESAAVGQLPRATTVLLSPAVLERGKILVQRVALGQDVRGGYIGALVSPSFAVGEESFADRAGSGTPTALLDFSFALRSSAGEGATRITPETGLPVPPGREPLPFGAKDSSGCDRACVSGGAIVAFMVMILTLVLVGLAVKARDTVVLRRIGSYGADVALQMKQVVRARARSQRRQEQLPTTPTDSPSDVGGDATAPHHHPSAAAALESAQLGSSLRESDEHSDDFDGNNRSIVDY